MIYLHIIIKQDRRTERRPTDNAFPVAWQADENAPIVEQLHVTDCTSDLQHTVKDTDGKERVIKGTDLANPNILMVRRWDTSKSYYEVLKGADVVPFTRVDGWPEKDLEQWNMMPKEEYDALPAPDSVLL